MTGGNITRTEVLAKVRAMISQDIRAERRPSADSTDASVVAVLRRAKKLVAAGWTQGFMAAPATGDRWSWSFCAYGAIRQAARELGPAALLDDALREAAQALPEPWRRMPSRLASGGASLVDWNDAPGRTQQEVLDLFDRAITEAKNKLELA